MTFGGTLLTIFEITMVAFVIWGVFHEDKFVAFEERIVAHFRRSRIKVIKGNNIRKTYYPVNDRRA